jgi:GxxExxY protein
MLSRVSSDLPAETERAAERIIGCAVEVHRQLGPGFLEGIYQDALSIELETAGLRYQREVPIILKYRGRPLRPHRLDLIVEDRIIVELKAVEHVDRIHRAQLMSYLRASGIRLGRLMNFNVEILKSSIRRVVM